jgi:DNA-binding CsgD family transcriptional regulator
VLQHLAGGLSTSETATVLNLGLEAVRTYLRRAMRTLGADSKLHAIIIALRAGQIALLDEPVSAAALPERAPE